MVARFQAGEVPVFLLSLKAGGTGLNLTRADHVVHLDRWWNPAVEDQATDRAYRIGQTKPVQVHRMVTVGTIEERIGELLARKKSLAESVLGNGEAALTELSDAELRDFVTLRRGRTRERRRRHPPPAAAAPRRPARRAAGGRGRGCGRSRRRRTPPRTWSPAGPWHARAGSGGSPWSRAASWPRSRTTARPWTVVGAVPVLDGAGAEAFVETVAAESGRVAALLAGDLPHALVEHAEEAGVELLPYGGELGATCTCEAWTDPCPHALAVLLQLGQLLDEDPFVLLHLRGLPREELLARLHALDVGAAPPPSPAPVPPARCPPPPRTLSSTTSTPVSTPSSAPAGSWSCSTTTPPSGIEHLL